MILMRIRMAPGGAITAEGGRRKACDWRQSRLKSRPSHGVTASRTTESRRLGRVRVTASYGLGQSIFMAVVCWNIDIKIKIKINIFVSVYQY